MTLQEFGVHIRDERLKSALSVEEIAMRLKITARMVRAMEEGNLSALPHAVYARAFIRAYAEMLGIDAAVIDDAVKNIQTNAYEGSLLETPVIRSGPGVGSVLLLLFVVALLGGLVYWGVTALPDIASLWASQSEQSMPAPLPASVMPSGVTATVPPPGAALSPSANTFADTMQGVPEAVAAPGTGGIVETGEPVAHGAGVVTTSVIPVASTILATAPTTIASVTSTRAGADAAAVMPVDERRPVRVSGFTLPDVGPLPKSTTLTLQNGHTQTAMSADTNNGRHHLIVTALSECWLHANADDTETRQMSIKKGETFSLSFAKKLILKLGNAGGVRVKYDGNDLAPLGAVGQVSTIIFPLQQ